MQPKLIPTLLPTLILSVLTAPAVQSEEGMWTLDEFPRQAVLDTLGVEVSDAWLERAQAATVRIDGGCRQPQMSSAKSA